MNKESLLLPVSTNHDIYIEKKGVPKRIYLLLHGYLLDGSYILKTLKDSLPDHSLVVAPNGPFVVPIKKKDRFNAKYAWYFFDPETKNYYINFEPAAQYLSQIIKKYNEDSLPVTIIGYSQGGYLSPKIAEVIPEVDTVVGLACTFRNNRFSYREDVIYHQINSKDDLIVEYEGSIAEFEALKSKGNKGEFISLKDIGHRIGEPYLNTLMKLI